MAAPKNTTPAQIINHLRKGEVVLANGETVKEVCKGLGISEPTYYRCRPECNTVRSHSSLGYRPPAPEAIRPRSGRYLAGVWTSREASYRRPSRRSIAAFISLAACRSCSYQSRWETLQPADRDARFLRVSSALSLDPSSALAASCRNESEST